LACGMPGSSSCHATCLPASQAALSHQCPRANKPCGWPAALLSLTAPVLCTPPLYV
jgi:hypothetical protein